MSVGGGDMVLVTPANHHADAIDTVKDAIMTVLFGMPDVSGLGRVRWMGARSESGEDSASLFPPASTMLHRMEARW